MLESGDTEKGIQAWVQPGTIFKDQGSEEGVHMGGNKCGEVGSIDLGV